ncbi:MAG: hypothetical protein NTX50_19530 [Candidatus Sumerlaeota bacterium]|nr:hypothetical protein [Candidatus Sumerlaeota bacterium]
MSKSHSHPARRTNGRHAPSSDPLRDLVRQLVEVRKQAEALGMFTHDRELLECPRCGLLEDVTFEGMLITYQKDAKDQSDSGLRFRPMDKATFQCPACGATCHPPAEDEAEAPHD